MNRFALDKPYIEENHVSGENNIGKHASFSVARGNEIIRDFTSAYRGSPGPVTTLISTRTRTYYNDLDHVWQRNMAKIAKEICSGKFLHNVDTMSYVMGAPNADTFQVPILIVNMSNTKYIQCYVSLSQPCWKNKENK